MYLVHKNLQFGRISQGQLPRIYICDLSSKVFSRVTEITLEAQQPHPCPVRSLPSGLMSSDFKGTLTGLFFGADSLRWFLNAGFGVQHLHRTGKSCKNQSIKHQYFCAFGLRVWPYQRMIPRLQAILSWKFLISSNCINSHEQNPYL